MQKERFEGKKEICAAKYAIALDAKPYKKICLLGQYCRAYIFDFNNFHYIVVQNISNL